ncbi:MAG: amidohydrolase [Acidobacteria bacterium]|nr:MAG: amidohydrolase [Acidobacteriota bacterium]
MPTKAIDIVVNLWTKEVTERYPPELDEFWALVKILDKTKQGIPIEQQIAEMDEAGIDKGLLVATTGGAVGSSIHFEKPFEKIAEVCNLYPDRFKGIIGINPSKIMLWMKKLETAVKEYGFVGAHLYPHWFGEPPDSRVYYPFYAKCAELGVPIQIQVGHSAQWFLRTVAEPITLDRIAIDFPELKIIGIHIGHPWTEQMISMAWKHKNVFIGTDAHLPKYWDKSLINFINTRGQDKVLFGTDYPVVDFKRAIEELNKLEIRETAKRKLLVENAVRVYNLEDWV